MFSYWEKKQFFFHRHLVICGAGFTGLSAAIYYKRKFPGKSVLVLERDVVNGGASTKNAGFACFGSPSELLADLKKSSEQDVFSLVKRRWDGLNNLRTLLGDERIGYEPLHGFELFRQRDALYEECLKNLAYLNKMVGAFIGRDVYRCSDEKIRTFGFNGIEHIIENTEEGQVDTGRMYASILKLAKESGVEVFNGISIDSFKESNGVNIKTSNGVMTADRFLIANNGFASQILSDSETIPARAQVLVTTPIDGLKVRGAFHIDEGFYYFRDADGRVLFGGGRNTDFETETTAQLGLNDRIQQHLEDMLHQVILPGVNFQIEQRWTGIMGMGKVKQVIVKPISEKVFCAIRLSGMGLALSTLLGKEVVEIME